MQLIRCDGCDAVHNVDLPVCPGCGRCPACGNRRLSKDELRRHRQCQDCATPFCEGCGRCHTCAAIRFRDYPGCSCGFPEDKEKRRAVVKTFGLQASDNRRHSGCLGLVALVFLATIGCCYCGV